MKTILVILAGMFLGGCFAGVETRSGWHMLSLPPSSGKRLAAQCAYAPLIVRSASQKLEDRGITESRIKEALK